MRILAITLVYFLLTGALSYVRPNPLFGSLALAIGWCAVFAPDHKTQREISRAPTKTSYSNEKINMRRLRIIGPISRQRLPIRMVWAGSPVIEIL